MCLRAVFKTRLYISHFKYQVFFAIEEKSVAKKKRVKCAII